MPDDIHQETYRELVRLRYGRGLQATGLRSRLGPRLEAACGIQRGDDDQAIRTKVTTVVQQRSASFPRDLRLAVTVGLGIDQRVWFPTLEKRQNWLAGQLDIADRSSRRRVDEACARLAQALRHAPRDPEQGWRVSRLNALLCLDTPSPELYEERTIVATRDGLSEIQTRASLPRPDPGDRSRRELITKVLYGVTLRREERLGATHFRHTLELPRALRQGETASYKIMYSTAPGQPIPPHYAFVPFAPCDSFHVRVRFAPERLPEAVWRLDRVAPRLLDEPTPDGTWLAPDAAGEVSQSFADLMQGFGYGVAWRPAGVGE